jgi:AmpD protein
MSETMQLIPETGRIQKACWIPSPNSDARPHPGFINTLVIHAISLPPATFGGHFVEDLFCNSLDTSQHEYFQSIAQLKVSSHFYIKRTGELIQFVSSLRRAWHAGLSEFKGLDTVNDFSIGIELEGCDELAFEELQYQTLVVLSQCLMRAYPSITAKRIVGHSAIAPGRKTDPGPCFDWGRVLESL